MSKSVNPSRSDFKYPSDFGFQKKVTDSVGFGCRFGIRHVPTPLQCEQVAESRYLMWFKVTPRAQDLLQKLVSLVKKFCGFMVLSSEWQHHKY